MATTYRPSKLNEYFGQRNAKQRLSILLKSVLKTGRSLDHILITGGPGLGKTTLAGIIAQELGFQLKSVHAGSIKKKDQLLSILMSIEHNEVLFFDEIHGLNQEFAELLYTVMEDARIDLAVRGNTHRIELPRYTIIGATTKSGMLEKPLLDRFGETIQLEDYSVEEIVEICNKYASSLGVELAQSSALNIAKRSLQNPRIAYRLVRRCVDFASACDRTIVNDDDVEQMCFLLGIDRNGLDSRMIKYLRHLADKNEPSGLNAIALYMEESIETIETAIEPTLTRMAFIERTTRGRVITKIGQDYVRV